LLLQGGHWDFVKGHVEKNESERETVLRETEEEVTDPNFIEGFRQPISYYYRRGGKTIWKRLVVIQLCSRTVDIEKREGDSAEGSRVPRHTRFSEVIELPWEKFQALR